MDRTLQSPATRAGIALGITAASAAGLILYFGDAAYLWVKAIHVVAIIAWMAGMLYLPRLFIYHTAAEPGSPQSETFKVMEQRLLRIIMNPAMIIAWALGLWLAWSGGWLTAPWFLAKLACVIALSAAHGHFSAATRQFAADKREKTARYWRYMNEVPTLLLIAIVIFVIVKPF